MSRRKIKISAATKARLAAHCAALGIDADRLVDGMINDGLDNAQQIIERVRKQAEDAEDLL